MFTNCLPKPLMIVALIGLYPAFSSATTVKEALNQVPVQKDVDYDRPAANELEKCKVSTEKIGKYESLVVRGPSGEMLRCFTDTNGDQSVDQWRY